MSVSRSLGSLVVRIVADGLGAYKAEMNAVAAATTDAAGKIDKSSKLAGAAAAQMGGGVAEAADAAMALKAGAGVAGVGVAAFAVVLGAAAYAAFKGAQEQLAYQKALILTGNAAGTTAGQMVDMARIIGQSVGTQYQAAEALAALAGTGQIAGSSLQKLGTVAVEMQRSMGVSVADTAKQFAELGQEPVKASLKLNEATHYLTASVYEQIKAAQDMGDADKAASLAQGAYADAMDGRTKQIVQNLGALESAWIKVKDSAKSAWNSMLNVGREDTLQQKIDFLQKALAGMDATGMKSDNFGRSREGLQRELETLLRMSAAENDLAARQSERIKREEASIALAEKADKFASNQVKMQREIAQARSAFENGNQSASDVANYAQAVAGITEKYKENAKAIKSVASEQEKAIKLSKEQIAAIKAEAKAIADAADANTKAVDALFDAQERTRVQTENQIQTTRTTLEQIEFETRLLEMNTEQRALATMERELERQGIVNGTLAYDAYIEKLREAMSIKEGKEAGIKAADELAKANRNAAEESGKYWEDALMRAFESGKGFFDSLWSTIKNTLKTQVLKVLVSATGMTGMSAANAGGMDGGFSNLVSGASGLYSSVSSLVGIGSQVAAGTMGIANALGTVAANATGTGISGLLATNGAFGTAAGGTTGLSATLAAIPGWGWAALGAVALYGVLKKDKTPSRGTGEAALTYGTDGNLISSNLGSANGGGLTQLANGVITSMSAAYYTTAKQLGINAAEATFGFGGNTGKDSKGANFSLWSGANGVGYTGSNNNSQSYTPEQLQLEASRAVFSALQASELPGYLSKVFDGITASTATQAAIDGTLAFAGALKAMKFELLDAPEKTQYWQDVVNAGFADLATSATTFRDDFSAAIDAGLTPETFAKWTSLGGSMEQLAAFTVTATDAVDGLSKVMESLNADRSNLDIELLRAQGNTTGANAAQRTLDTATYTEAEVAAYDYNAALRLQITTLNDATVAAEALAATNQGWKDQLDILTGKETDRSIALRDATDDSTRSLMLQVWAQQDLATAAQATTLAITDAADMLKGAKASLLGTVTGNASDAYSVLQRSVNAQKKIDQAAYDTAQKEATADYEAQKAVATAAYTSQQAVMQASIDSTRASLDAVGISVGKLKSLSTSLKSTLDGMRVSGSESVYRRDAQAQISAALATARRGGGLPMDGQLESALATVSKPSEALFSTFEDYARDFYKTANDISSLSGLTDAQLSTDEATQAILKAQLEGLDDQSKLLKDSFAEQVDTLKDGFDAQVKALDTILENAQRQLDAANGINTSVLTVAQALGVFKAAVSNLETVRDAQGLATTPGVAAPKTEAELAGRADIIRTYMEGLNANSNLMMVDKAVILAAKAMENGITEAEIASAWGSSTEDTRAFFAAAGVPKFAVGTNYVPGDMIAQIHEGEAIVPKAYNPAAGGQNNAELIAEIKVLQAEVRSLKSSNEATAAHTKKFAAQFDTASEGGRALLTEAYA